jgi:2-polyprenyl-3-methyl-5-hydroxy-6-metoxy-1,4-benzoquinol methylase
VGVISTSGTAKAGAADSLPLDLDRTKYSYIERPTTELVSLVTKHIASKNRRARILDIGCGCAANARAVRGLHPEVHVTGVEPNARAVELAREACDDVFHGTMDQWLAMAQASPGTRFDGVVLADVVEHIADPITFVRSLVNAEALRGATWVISVPNYAVWYNRMRTLFGLQSYGWSGLWDRTHLRFFTRRTARQLFEYCGLTIVDETCTPSITQSAAPALRKLFEREVERGEHLALTESPAFRAYREWVEPAETRVCRVWPELLGFQVVLAARGPG